MKHVLHSRPEKSKTAWTMNNASLEDRCQTDPRSAFEGSLNVRPIRNLNLYDAQLTADTDEGHRADRMGSGGDGGRGEGSRKVGLVFGKGSVWPGN